MINCDPRVIVGGCRVLLTIDAPPAGGQPPVPPNFQSSSPKDTIKKPLTIAIVLLGLISGSVAQGAPKRLYKFTGGADSATPYGALIDVGGILYG